MKLDTLKRSHMRRTGAPGVSAPPRDELSQLHDLHDAARRVPLYSRASSNSAASSRGAPPILSAASSRGAPPLSAPIRIVQGEFVVVPRRVPASASRGGGSGGGGDTAPSSPLLRPVAGGSVISRMSSARSSIGGGANSLKGDGGSSRSGSGSGSGSGVPLARSAANSHVANDRYMNEFEEAYTNMYGKDIDPTPSLAPALAIARYSARRETLLYEAAGRTIPAMPAQRLPGVPSTAWSSVGPADAAGMLLDLSDRPLLVAARDPRATGAHAEVLIGGSDHAVYGVDAVRGTIARKLYGGRTGHTEWVTGVTYLGDASGRAVSCGMDGRVCVWGTGGSTRAPPSCSILEGHFGSVTTVAAPGGGTAAGGAPSSAAAHLFLSAGYDKTLKIWDSRRGAGATIVADLRGHDAPILALALRAHDVTQTFLVASGDRGGTVCVWDGVVAAPVANLKGHKGHVTSLAWMGNLLLSGAQDGCVRVWDTRDTRPVAVIAAHATSAGSGAVGDIVLCGFTEPEPAEPLKAPTSTYGGSGLSRVGGGTLTGSAARAAHLSPAAKSRRRRRTPSHRP